jgi:ribosomal protein L29
MVIVEKFKKLLDLYSNLHTYQELSDAEKNLQEVYREKEVLTQSNEKLSDDIHALKNELNQLLYQRAMNTLSEDERKQVVKKQIDWRYTYYYEKINHEISENVSNSKWTFQLCLRDIGKNDRDVLLLLSNKFAEDKIKINVREPIFESTGAWAAWKTFIDINVRAKYVDTNTSFNYH